jgi:hypothetical protein
MLGVHISHYCEACRDWVQPPLFSCCSSRDRRSSRDRGAGTQQLRCHRRWRRGGRHCCGPPHRCRGTQACGVGGERPRGRALFTDMHTFGIPYDRGAHWLYAQEINPVARLALRPASTSIPPRQTSVYGSGYAMPERRKRKIFSQPCCVASAPSVRRLAVVELVRESSPNGVFPWCRGGRAIRCSCACLLKESRAQFSSRP